MISGLIKTSFVDYPDEPSFVIFFGGCNFRCPFCHNKSIVLKTTDAYNIADVLEMLKIRKGFINAVVITGGEPTIYKDELYDLIKKIKELGFRIKLDTNGTNPDVVRYLIDNNLIDYVAMDIKNSFAKYNDTCGVKVNIDNIKESIKLLENSNIKYQFRTTLNKEMHTISDIDEIRSYIKEPNKLVLQDYKYSKEQIIDKDFGIFEF